MLCQSHVLSYALFTQSVKYGTYRIQPEMMLLKKVRLDHLQLITVEMDQLAAFLTLAVETGRNIFMAVRPDIFKAGRTVSVNVIFFQDPFIDQVFQIPIDRRLSDRRIMGSEIFTYITGRNMNSRNSFKIAEQYLALFCLVLRSRIHLVPPFFNMGTVPDYSIYRRVVKQFENDSQYFDDVIAQKNRCLVLFAAADKSRPAPFHPPKAGRSSQEIAAVLCS